MGSGYGSVGRTVAYDTRDPRFKSKHKIGKFLSTNWTIEKTKIKKRGREWPIFKKNLLKLCMAMINYFAGNSYEVSLRSSASEYRG